MYNYIILISSILLGALGQVLFKLGINKASGEGISFFIGLCTNIPVVLGFSCYGFSFLLWMLALKHFDISLARPLTSIGYIVTYVLAVLILGEKFTVSRVAGTIIITVGVLLLK